MQWAMTQNNFGGALLRLGEREDGMVRFEAAIEAFNGALAVFIAASAIYYVEECWENRDRTIALLAKRRDVAVTPEPPRLVETPSFSRL